MQNSLFNDKKQKVVDIVGSAECKGARCLVGFFLFRNGDYRVLATDYTKYAVVYSCSTSFFFFKSESMWILSRDEILDSTNKAQAESIIQTRVPAYTLDNFYYTKQGGTCTYLE